MTGTVGGFCRDLLDDHERGLRPGTEGIAARFVEYFQISPRPDLDELTDLVRRAGFGEVAEMSLEEGLKGVHFGTPGDEYHIYYRDELWQGSKEYTVLHEMYEIMHETLCELHSGTRAPTKVCREADRFAAEVLMQPEGFRALAEAWRLDVAALQQEYRYAYAAVALRLAEVVRRPPLLVVLYERPDRRDPARWPAGNDLAALRAKVVRRTKGLGPPGSGLVTGRRGGIPNRDRRIPAPAPWLSRRPAAEGRSTPRTTAWPWSPGPFTGRGAWPRSSWSPCPPASAPRSCRNRRRPAAGAPACRRRRRLDRESRMADDG